MALTGLVLILLAGRWLLRRRRRLPEIPGVDWRVRAEAERRRADRAEGLVKAGLLPHLAEYLRQKLVVGLLRQRRQLLNGQEEGTHRTWALEQRLASAQATLRKRLVQYEARIRELEQQDEAVEAQLVGPQGASDSGNRRNPLVRRPVLTEAAPMKFQEILARRRGELSTPGQAADDKAVRGGGEDNGES